MEHNGNRKKIDLYFDGELNREEEILLFSTLASDQDSREYFKEMNKIKVAINDSMVDFPEELEEKIYKNIGRTDSLRSFSFFPGRSFSFIAAAAIIFFILLSFFFWKETTYYKTRFETTMTEINRQNQMLQVLLNSIPAAEVKARAVNNFKIN